VTKSTEFERFDSLMRKLVKVPRSELKAALSPVHQYWRARSEWARGYGAETSRPSEQSGSGST